MRFRWSDLPLRAPDGDPGPGPAAPAAAPSAPAPVVDSLISAPATPPPEQSPATPQTPASPQAPPAPSLKFDTRPEWLKEAYYDPATKEVRVEQLAKAEADLRAKMGAGDHKAPKDAAGYELDKLDFGDDAKTKAVAAQVLGVKDDPVIGGVLKAGVELGISKTQMQGLVAAYLKNGAEFLPPPYDPAAEKAKLGERADPIIKEVTEFGQTLVKRGFISDADWTEFQIMAGTADGIKIINAMRSYYGEAPMEVRADHAQATTATADQLRTKQAALVERREKGENVDREWNDLQQEYAALYGTRPAGTSARAA